MATPQNMTRREFLKTIGLGTAALGVSRQLSAQGKRRPNILLIVADDLGYAGIGCQGCTDIPTPNIDSLATNGVRLTNGYVSCPVCAPTRAGLMTGRYQQRFGLEFNPGPEATAASDYGLPLSEATLAERLKRLGYATGMVGKWHLGYRPEFSPPKRGFDEFFGFLGGSHPYLPGKGGGPILRGLEPVEEKEYLTDAFAREAVAFIEKHRREPFFLYLAFNAVHAPMEASEKYLERFKAIKDERRRIHAAMLAAMDDAVGQVLATLRKHRLEEDTLVFFISDNGGPTGVNTSRNDPLRGFKGQVLEGGVRVPFIVQWKGVLPAGKVDDRPVIALDILPTALAAAGGSSVPEGKLDGVNLLPYLRGENPNPPHAALFWRFGEQWAIRQGAWKLVQDRQAPRPQLYNLEEDVGESRDLFEKEPKRVRELTERWQAWNAELVAPRWGRGAQQKRQERGEGARQRRRVAG